MAEDNDFYDADDIRRRGKIDQHPEFYWRAIYQPESNNYVVLPFMHINNSDTGRADNMEVCVLQKHIVRYNKEYNDFIKAQHLEKTEFTRDEMMHVQNFRDKISYNKKIILLPPEHPEYEKMISDFSLRLNPEDVDKLNSLDGVPYKEPEEEKQPTKDKKDKLYEIMNLIADKLDRMDERISALESK